MTVEDFICRSLLGGAEDRYFKLIEINAPKVIIESCEKFISDLKSGTIKVGGDKSCLADEFKSFEVRKGVGGKTYLHINGNINFFPQARYGMYIKRV